MKSFKIKLQKPGTKLEKQNQLAWLIANMAAEDWSLTKEISDMVGNRIIDNIINNFPRKTHLIVIGNQKKFNIIKKFLLTNKHFNE